MGDTDRTADHAGHRERLRARIIEAGADSLHDYELLEYLLSLAIPRRDTKALAKQLLTEFGGFGPLLAADAGTLKAVPYVGDSVVAMLRALDGAVRHVLLGEVAQRSVLGNWQGLVDYLRASMAQHLNERVRILHLDSRNQLIRDEVVSEGSIDQSAIYVREVVRRALQLGSAAIIVAHNHPSGDATPSSQDIAVTRALIAACKPLGIALHDHVIVARGDESRITSMRSAGLI